MEQLLDGIQIKHFYKNYAGHSKKSLGINAWFMKMLRVIPNSLNINILVLLPHLLLSWGDDHLAIIANIAGKVTPSPRPSIILTAYKRYFRFAATGVTRVNTAVIKTPKFNQQSKFINQIALRWMVRYRYKVTYQSCNKDSLKI